MNHTIAPIIDHPEAGRYSPEERVMMRQVGIRVAMPEDVAHVDSAAREFAKNNRIDWEDVAPTQRLIDACIIAHVGDNLAKMQAIVDQHTNGSRCNFVKVLVNAESLGITDLERIRHFRHALRDCLCGTRFDAASAATTRAIAS